MCPGVGFLCFVGSAEEVESGDQLRLDSGSLASLIHEPSGGELVRISARTMYSLLVRVLGSLAPPENFAC